MTDTHHEQRSETYQVPTECVDCGGPIDYAERSDDGKTILLCRGDCGQWSEIDE